MAPGGGLINRAAASLGALNQDGPGYLYYGINAADRGLGYRGSYMTLGGFIPYAQDDLGGFWSADLRGHLSNYGGGFTNLGVVRKQFVGGTVLGVGVYWDYDGDQNQYSDTTITDASGSYLFAGGETYNQIGVSGEWLTDWGNLRSNGYIPLGTTATTMGPYVGNSLLCQYGINAALGGADLELGAYIPGLADWAGMISVGGYAFGNVNYDFPGDKAVVPWFGGVFTRLDMTFLENWDFSLQANNDSYFDWTGFARVSYRMGGSRRRSVPDQMEQPMMRNEHIVRAHQAPQQAINPFTDSPWRVFHVDNSSSGPGAGTNENPFATLAQAESAANADYDIVFVHQGMSATQPYLTDLDGYAFGGNYQYLVGEGTGLFVPAKDCGLVTLWANQRQANYPQITNPSGPAIVLTNGTTTGATVDHLRIVGSHVGISDGPGLPVASPPLYPKSFANVNDVQIVGTGPNQRGVLITDSQFSNGEINFTNMTLQNLTNDGFVVSTGTGGAPSVNIANTTIADTVGSAVRIENLGAPVPPPGVAGPGRVRVTDSAIVRTTGPGIIVRDGQLLVEGSSIRTDGTVGVDVVDNSTVQVAFTEISGVDIGVRGQTPTGGSLLNLTVNDNVLTPNVTGNGIVLAVPFGGGDLNGNLVGNRITVGQTNASAILLQNNNGAGNQDLKVRAADLPNLRGINRGATVQIVPPRDESIPIPPPPFFDQGLVVPLPPQ